jgi:hypothetical protein
VEDIKQPLMQEVRYSDKLIDELAKRKPMETFYGHSDPDALILGFCRYRIILFVDETIW